MIGTVIFRDSKQQSAAVKFREVTDLASLDTLTGVLQTYSDAAAVKDSVMDSTIDATPTYGTGAYKMVDQKAVITYRDLAAGPDDTSVFRFELPGPKVTMFEETLDGWRVTAVAGAAIIAGLSAATGKTLEFVEGWLYSGK